MLVAMIDVRPVGPDDWQVWRALRLTALAEAPHAFSSVLADWQGAGDREERWRSRLAGAGSCTFVAYVDGDPAGMAGGSAAAGATDRDEPAGVVEVVSMWVDPVFRGRGVGAELLRAVERWACRRGVGELRLAVMLGNDPARRLYERQGYVDTGLREVLPDGVREEAVLAKPLGPAGWSPA
jgi:ribosomal protein S18 acetylase RimI-like enzyme